MKVKKTVADSIVPAGSYLAAFIELSEHAFPEKEDGPYGPDDGLRWKWTFEIIDGPQSGKTTEMFTTRTLSQKSNAGKYYMRLASASIIPDEVDFATLYGIKCHVNVVARPGKDFTNCADFSKAPQ